MTENKVERLAALVGGFAEIARIISRCQTVVHRMRRRGIVRPEFNQVIKTYVSEDTEHDKAWRLDVLGCLEPETCPTCGRPL